MSIAFEPSELCAHSRRRRHKLPAVYYGEDFNGFAADVFSAATVLMFMVLGFRVWHRPADHQHRAVVNSGLRSVLAGWALPQAEDDPLMDLLEGMLRADEGRLSLQQVLEHPWCIRAQ